MTTRYVRRNRRIYNFSSCLLCGCACGIVKGEAKVCRPTTCLACGSRQCMVNGLGRGQCSICLIGLLPGWSGNNRTCQYIGCTNHAIVACDGVNIYRCKDHVERGKWIGYIDKQVSVRDKAWIEVDDSGPFPLLGET